MRYPVGEVIGFNLVLNGLEFSDIGGKRAVRIDPGQALLLKQGGGS